MSFTTRINPDRRIAIAVGRGPFSLDDAGSALADVVRDPDFEAGMCLLWDVRRRETVPTHEEARAWVELTRPYHDELGDRMAILTRPGVQYGMGRMIQILSDLAGFEIRVFVDPDHAAAWLRKEPDATPPD